MTEKLYRYVIAIDAKEPPRAFTEFIEKFAPRFSLSCGVHVLLHSKNLSLAELRELVRPTLPQGTPFYVSIDPEGEFVPNPKDDEEKKDIH